jgi:putative transcriptional regulator
MRKALFAVVIAAALATSPAFIHAGEGVGVLPVRMPDAPASTEPDPFSVLPAKGKFLVATRNLIDPRFQETVVLLIDYSSKGATGLIINRPTQVPLLEILPSVRGLKKQTLVYYGGPVEGYRMLMLIQSNEKPVESASVFGNVYVSSSKNTLEHLAADKKGRQFRIYAGYAAWSSGQLDREVAQGDWLVVLADARSVFEKKSTEIWRELLQRGSAIQVWKQDEHDFPLALAEPLN